MTKPSPEFLTHHDVAAPRVDARAFRQGWRVVSRLDALLDAERITRGEYQAAVEFRATWARARQLSAGREPGMAGMSAGSPDAAVIARLDALGRIRRIEDGIGRLGIALLTACVVEDMSWAATARYCHRNPETVREWTVTAIRALAVAWRAAGPGLAAPPLPADLRRRHRPVRPENRP